MAIRDTTELIHTFAPDLEETGGLIDLGMIVGREVSCECDWCPEYGIWKLVPDDGNQVVCGVCMITIDTAITDEVL